MRSGASWCLVWITSWSFPLADVVYHKKHSALTWASSWAQAGTRLMILKPEPGPPQARPKPDLSAWAGPSLCITTRVDEFWRSEVRVRMKKRTARGRQLRTLASAENLTWRGLTWRGLVLLVHASATLAMALKNRSRASLAMHANFKEASTARVRWS